MTIYTNVYFKRFACLMTCLVLFDNQVVNASSLLLKDEHVSIQEVLRVIMHATSVKGGKFQAYNLLRSPFVFIIILYFPIAYDR